MVGLPADNEDFQLTVHRSDNDMYNHMNNSVYYFLYVAYWLLLVIGPTIEKV